jgi:hypothetical protein
MEFTRKNTAVQFYNSLPPWAKGVVVVGGLAITYVIINGIVKKIKADASLKKERGTVDFQNQELQNIINAGIRPTFPQSQYAQWADEIQNQFDGCDVSPFSDSIGFFSNSGATLKSIVDNLENDADFLALQTAYDIRTYDQCGWWMGNVTGTLSKAVNDELATNEIAKINEILESKGITYKY